MKFADKINEMGGAVAPVQKDPVDTDPNVVRMATEVAKIEQQLAQKKALLNQMRARVAGNIAKAQTQKSMTMDNAGQPNSLGVQTR